MPKRSKVKVKRYGTTNIKRFFKDVVEPTLLKVNRRIVRDVAQTAAREVQIRIRQQLFDHVPLSENYLKWKRRAGLDRRILIRTKTYVDNIGVQEVQFPRGIGYRVGVPEGVRTPVVNSKGEVQTKPGPLLTDLANWLEVGTQTMPARPHWMPVYRDIIAAIRNIKTRTRFYVEKQLKAEVRGMR
jgi:hypothetical protein